MSDSPGAGGDPGAASGSGDNNSQEALDCPICLQPCTHPVELPCRHVFCFLCIKGVTLQGRNGKCAICRASIPASALTNPQLKDASQLDKEPKLANGYQWYYESRSGGWWLYDEKTMNELEREFSSKKPTCQVLLAGHVYVVDFGRMIQHRLNDSDVSRRIRREQQNLEKRGVAGISIPGTNSGAGATSASSAPAAAATQQNQSSNSNSRLPSAPPVDSSMDSEDSSSSEDEDDDSSNHSEYDDDMETSTRGENQAMEVENEDSSTSEDESDSGDY